MFKLFFFLIGFGLTTIGFVYNILYLNLFNFGYNFFEYVNFIIRRIECLNTILGIFLIIISLNFGGKYELYIWYLHKF